MEKAQIVLDSIDIKIYELIENKKGITIGEVKEKINITHANLIPHLKRLENLGLIDREREQQTIHLKTYSNHGEFFNKVLKRLEENRTSLKTK